jgi:FlaA1/EpsC-like NDP-sugar epimerase
MGQKPMRSEAVERWSSTTAFRTALILGYDAVASLAGLYLALMLRLAGDVRPEFALSAKVAAPFLVAIRLATVIAARLHRWSFRMSGLAEAARLAMSMLAASVVFVAAVRGLPRSVYVLEFFLTVSFMAALRFAPRFLSSWYAERQRRASRAAHRTLIVGAGGTGDLLMRDLLRSQKSKYVVIGFVDDDKAKLGIHVSGKPVLGAIDDLPELIERHRISTVLLAIPGLPAARLRQILDLCAASSPALPSPSTWRRSARWCGGGGSW